MDFELDRVIIGDGSVVRGFVGFVVTHAIPELEGVILRLWEIRDQPAWANPSLRFIDIFWVGISVSWSGKEEFVVVLVE